MLIRTQVVINTGWLVFLSPYSSVISPHSQGSFVFKRPLLQNEYARYTSEDIHIQSIAELALAAANG